MAAGGVSALKCRPTREKNVGGQLVRPDLYGLAAAMMSGAGSRLQITMEKIRLPEDIYSLKNQPCLISICAKDKKDCLTHKSFTDLCIDLLVGLSKKNDIMLLTYCFMPNHIHLVISVQGNKSIVDSIRKFKSISTIKSRQFGFEGGIYQNRLNDHFIKKEERLNEAIMYVLSNPVRKGLVDNWEDFPYSGYCR